MVVRVATEISEILKVLPGQLPVETVSVAQASQRPARARKGSWRFLPEAESASLERAEAQSAMTGNDTDIPAAEEQTTAERSASGTQQKRKPGSTTHPATSGHHGEAKPPGRLLASEHESLAVQRHDG